MIEIKCDYGGNQQSRNEYVHAILQISISHSDADISRLVLDGKDYSTVEFEGLYMAGPYRQFGNMMFQVNKSLTIHQDSCPTPTIGCMCGNERKKVCQLQGEFNCPPSACSGQFQPPSPLSVHDEWTSLIKRRRSYSTDGPLLLRRLRCSNLPRELWKEQWQIGSPQHNRKLLPRGIGGRQKQPTGQHQ